MIRFIADGESHEVCRDPASGAGRTLLAIAREAGVPLLFNCETGHCGACIVVVRTIGRDGTLVQPPTESERFLLLAMRYLSPSEIAAADAGCTPAGVRLACQYRVGDEDIVVDYGQRPCGGVAAPR